MKKDINHKIEKELEELSWKFMLEANELKNKVEESVFLENTKEDDRVTVKDKIDSEIEKWYLDEADDNGINNMGRDKGIIFDEDKLESYKITEWHKPEKFRYSWYDKLFIFLKQIISLPFQGIWFVVSNFFRGLYTLGYRLIFGAYNIFKTILVIAWQVVVAFKYAWIYLFGESYLFNKKRVSTEVNLGDDHSSLREVLIFKKVAAFVVVAILLVLPFQVYLSINKVKSVKGQVLGASELGLVHLREAGENGINFNFQTAGDKFNLAENEFRIARDSVNELGLVANSIGNFIPDVKAGKNLLEVAQLSAEVGGHLTKVANIWDKVSMAIEVDKPVEVEDVAWGGELDELNMALNKSYKMEEILNKVDLSKTELKSYSSQLEKIKQQLPVLIGWLSNSKDVFEILTYIIGVDEPRRFMLVFQNNAELRPTGGFMGSYAIIDMKGGKIKHIEVPGGGFYDLKGSLSVSVEAPYPFRIFSPIWQPWNANWFPDFRASAKKIMWFYDKSGGPSVDGVIAFTPDVLEKLLRLVGEIKMDKYDTVVNADNFLRTAQREVELEYDKKENKPKQFIGDLLPKILDKVSKLEETQLLEVWQTISDSLLEKQLLVYLNNEELQKNIESFGWAGEIKDYEKDYLLVVHTNIVGGKTDRVIKTSIDHKAEILEDGSIVDTIVLTKKHLGEKEDFFEGQPNSDYVRFYVPQGSQLLSADNFDKLPAGRKFQVSSSTVAMDDDLRNIERNLRVDSDSHTRITDEFGKTVFGNWMSVNPGETKSVTIKYLLPYKYRVVEKQTEIQDNSYSMWDKLKKYFFGIRKIQKEIVPQRIYSIRIQKQPGTRGYGLTSRVEFGESWGVKSYLPESGIQVDGNEAIFKGNLLRDEYYGVVLSK